MMHLIWLILVLILFLGNTFWIKDDVDDLLYTSVPVVWILTAT